MWNLLKLERYLLFAQLVYLHQYLNLTLNAQLAAQITSTHLHGIAKQTHTFIVNVEIYAAIKTDADRIKGAAEYYLFILLAVAHQRFMKRD